MITKLTINEIEELRKLSNKVFLMLYIFDNNIGVCNLSKYKGAIETKEGVFRDIPIQKTDPQYILNVLLNNQMMN